MVRTPSITLVRSVTVNTTRRVTRPSSSMADPSKVYCMPDVSGNHWLSTLVGLENRLGS